MTECRLEQGDRIWYRENFKVDFLKTAYTGILLVCSWLGRFGLDRVGLTDWVRMRKTWWENRSHTHIGGYLISETRIFWGQAINTGRKLGGFERTFLLDRAGFLGSTWVWYVDAMLGTGYWGALVL